MTLTEISKDLSSKQKREMIETLEGAPSIMRKHQLKDLDMTVIERQP
jgi:hypothetical protein